MRDFWRFGSVNAEIASDSDCAIFGALSQYPSDGGVAESVFKVRLDSHMLWELGQMGLNMQLLARCLPQTGALASGGPSLREQASAAST